MLTIEILDQLDSIEEYGYVGCYAIKEEEVKKISDDTVELLKKGIDYLEELSDKMTESFEY